MSVRSPGTVAFVLKAVGDSVAPGDLLALVDAVQVGQAKSQLLQAIVQRRLRKTVWMRGGCTSWYLDDHGRNPILWPRGTGAFRRAVKEFDVDAYDVRAPADVGSR